MGFLITKEYPSRFLKGEEIADKEELHVKIKDVKKEQYFCPKTNKKEQTLVVYFEGATKGVALGKQRAYDLKDATGSDDTDNWGGKTVTLYTEKKNAFGKINDVIRFKKCDEGMNETEKKKLSKELDSQSE